MKSIWSRIASSVKHFAVDQQLTSLSVSLFHQWSVCTAPASRVRDLNMNEHANPQVARCSRPFQRPDNRRTRRGQLSRGHLRIWTAPTNPVPVSSANMHGTGTTQPAAIAVLAKRQVSFPSVARSNIMGPCSCSRFTNHHACEASQLHRIAGEYANMIEALRGSSSRSEPERFVKARSRLQASMFRSERRSTARLRAAAGRCMLLVRAGDSHYTNRHKGLRRSKQGV